MTDPLVLGSRPGLALAVAVDPGAELPDRLFRSDAVGTTDASGDLTIGPVWQAPQGWRINIHRVLVDYAGSSPDSPHSCDVRVSVSAIQPPTPSDQETLADAIPAVLEWSAPGLAVAVRPGQSVFITLAGAPPNTRITAVVRGALTEDD